ncbi:MAG: hypothetical protein WC657_05635 [Candidatus Paceibacterota bacterium]|jgi:hypothetical protein
MSDIGYALVKNNAWVPHVYKIGARVQSKADDECRFSGKVIGHGVVNNSLVLLVQLDEGSYVENKCVKAYVSTLIVHPSNIE